MKSRFNTAPAFLGWCSPGALGAGASDVTHAMIASPIQCYPAAAGHPFFRFASMEDDLLQQVGRIWIDEEKNLFPFEKEVTLFLFRAWVLCPEYGPRRTFTARFLAGIVTLQHYDAGCRPKLGRLKTLTELRERVAEPWYEEFYKHFVSQELLGGIERLIDAGRTPRQQDEIIDKTIRLRAISVDMLDYLLRATDQVPDLAKVNVATKFITLNGFNRP